MSEASTRSYDDLPEADVATVLEVPLLWGPAPSGPSTSPGRARRTHRAPSTASPASTATVGRKHPAGRHRAADRGPYPARHAGVSWRDQATVRTLEVGLTSALLVVVVVGGGLLALAAWLP